MPTTVPNPAMSLKEGRARLIQEFLEGRAPDLLEQQARLIDEFFRRSFEISMIGPRMEIAKNPFAIIALGGYGRGDQCVHSDVDLLVLFAKRVPAQAEGLIREIVYPLWDIGLEVGHATRSLRECLALASGDFEILTPLLDARFVTGMSNLYSALQQQLRDKVIERKSRRIIDWLVETNQNRHARFGDSAHLLEPNLKEGQGGLRDYHTMLWIARIRSQLKEPRDLEYLGMLSHDEYNLLSAALTFIFKVRNRLHVASGRKNDQLRFEQQIELSRDMGYGRANGQEPVECFLGDLHGHMEYIQQLHLMFLFEQGYEQRFRRTKRRAKQPRVEGVEVVREALNFISSRHVVRQPLLLIKIFEESARLKLPLSSEARRIVKEFGHFFSPALACSPEAVKAFEHILTAPAPTFSPLSTMLHTGLLARLIPEFQEIQNRIQYDEYHLYPVDLHSLRTVQALKQMGYEDPPPDGFARRLFDDLKHPKLLLWAALLHDIGKGQSGGNHAPKGAALTAAILAAKGYRPEEIETAAFLVREHLLLVNTALRRDINDEETAIACARIIGDAGRLEMLYLLTMADSQATGPKAWNSWTAALVKDLFFKILNTLEKGELASREAATLMALKQEAVRSMSHDPEERPILDELARMMSPRYLLNVPVTQVQRHVHLYRRLGTNPFAWEIQPEADSNTRLVTICAHDRPGLFSKIAGVFTLNNIDILDAQVFTWRNNVALDLLKVTPPPDILFEEDKWGQAERHLQEALAGRLDLATRVRKRKSPFRPQRSPAMGRPARIEINNRASSFFTIIEVFATDYPGLLFNITDALFRCHLDIWVAKIATHVDQVVDVFYVRDLEGQKVDNPEQLEMITDAIGTALPEIDAAAPASAKG